MYNIAIDGPSGAGKSTVAKLLAKKLGIVYLDTGAMYRAAALSAIRNGKDVNNATDAEQTINGLDIEVKYEGGEQKIYLSGEDVSAEIRRHEISRAASDISKHPAVRGRMSALQRELAARSSCVLDGRDIGTYVLPKAEYKFFVTADLSERARRRQLELGGGVSFETVYEDMKNRDLQDTQREVAPLRQAEDAVLIDTTGLTVEQVIEKIAGYIAR